MILDVAQQSLDLHKDYDITAKRDHAVSDLPLKHDSSEQKNTTLDKYILSTNFDQLSVPHPFYIKHLVIHNMVKVVTIGREPSLFPVLNSSPIPRLLYSLVPRSHPQCGIASCTCTAQFIHSLTHYSQLGNSL